MKPKRKPSPARPWQRRVATLAAALRRRVLEHTVRHNGGYLSQACSAAETLATLYVKVMKLGPVASPISPPDFAGTPGGGGGSFLGHACNGPRGRTLDRFILSPSQYSLVLYALLIELGRLAPDALEQFNRDGSTLEMIGAEHSPGMEVMSGSLGQGLSQAGGIALARQLKGETGRTWVFMSDGEFQAGQTWEALQTLAFYKVDRIGIYVDVNGQQCDGRTETVMNIEPLHERVAAFGCRVFRVDGHDAEALAAPGALKPDGRPLVVLADTDPCRGVEALLANAPKLHYLRFKTSAEREAYRRLLQE
ncbi:MAG: transketolase, partial [Planctomycetota bacterium]|nr:transketolase [Planctomycetota bacterium]